jgi:glycerol-3-phosphate acyltransferase PlsY
MVFLLSYLVGSIPNGFLVGKIYGVDIRQLGSKNIGATNVYRTLGFRPALVVFITDALKGVAGVCLGLVCIGTPIAALLGGIGAIIGHNWSLFLGFKGGRGVATAVGVIAILLPKVTIIVFFVWLIIVYFTRYVSLGSIIGAAVAPPLTYYLSDRPEYFYFAVVAALFVIIRHRPNIQRLIKGEELKIKSGGSTVTEKEVPK